MAGINTAGATFGANLLLNFELGGAVVTASSPAQRALCLATACMTTSPIAVRTRTTMAPPAFPQ